MSAAPVFFLAEVTRVDAGLALVAAAVVTGLWIGCAIRIRKEDQEEGES